MKTGIVRVLKHVEYLFIPYLILLSGCLLISVTYTKQQIYFTVNSWHFPLGDVFFAWWTNWGDGLVAVVITLIILFFNYRKAFLVGSSFAITAIIAQSLKWIFGTARPTLFYKTELSRIYLIKGVAMLETNSFPSGHTVSAFSAALVLTYITPKKRWGLLFVVMAILVGYSRMYLSEHFFEDVVGGSAIGVLVTVIWVSFIDARAFIHSPKWNRGLLNHKKA